MTNLYNKYKANLRFKNYILSKFRDKFQINVTTIRNFLQIIKTVISQIIKNTNKFLYKKKKELLYKVRKIIYTRKILILSVKYIKNQKSVFY